MGELIMAVILVNILGFCVLLVAAPILDHEVKKGGAK